MVYSHHHYLVLTQDGTDLPNGWGDLHREKRGLWQGVWEEFNTHAKVGVKRKRDEKRSDAPHTERGLLSEAGSERDSERETEERHREGPRVIREFSFCVVPEIAFPLIRARGEEGEGCVGSQGETCGE